MSRTMATWKPSSVPTRSRSATAAITTAVPGVAPALRSRRRIADRWDTGTVARISAMTGLG